MLPLEINEREQRMSARCVGSEVILVRPHEHHQRALLLLRGLVSWLAPITTSGTVQAPKHIWDTEAFPGQNQQTRFLGSLVGFKVFNSNVTQCSDATLATGAATAVVCRHLLVRMGTTRQVCS